MQPHGNQLSRDAGTADTPPANSFAFKDPLPATGNTVPRRLIRFVFDFIPDRPMNAQWIMTWE